MQSSVSSSSDYECEYHNHLCSSPMKKPKASAMEISQNEANSFKTINDKFALKILHDMWKSGNFYWNLGTNLLMINPNRNTTKNTRYTNKNTSNSSISSNMLPFITNISDNLSHSKQNQSIIALGIAGSGKTYTTQGIVSHFVSQNNSNTLNLVDIWNNIQTIYKIFGSYCHGHNVESNGCARIIKLIYETNGTLQGILCESLLWNKSIIPSSSSFHNTDDPISGYFHIFPIVINHPNYLKNPLTNKIKQNDIFLSYPVPYNDHHQSLIKLQESMNALMIPSISQKEIFDIIYSILCLNQINFVSNDKSIDSLQSVSITINKTSLPFAKHICYLLQYEAKDFLQYLMTQTINTQNQTFTRPHISTIGAYKKIERLCCILYECCIEWLFDHIDSLCLNYIHNDRVTNFISIIDFPGFVYNENGNHNFDQFCINFCNENLQQLFNSLILQKKQELYVEDGLNWIITPIPDYSKVIDLIASPPNGIFQIMSKYKNESEILHKIREHHPFKHQLINIAKRDTSFIIHHYHGDIKYDAKDFTFNNNCNVLKKNDDIISLLSKSNLNIIKKFMESVNKEQNTQNTGNKINFQLRNLIKVIKTTNMNNILCVNSSQHNTDCHFSRDYVLSQIKSLSIVETLRISLNGYGSYIESNKLLTLYNNYCTDNMNKVLSELAVEQRCEAVLVLFGIHINCYKFGLSKVFIKHSALKEMHELESFDGPQLSSIQRDRLNSYIQRIKIRKLSGLSKAYCRLNHGLQHQRAFDSIKTVLFLQRLMKKGYKLKEKYIGSIPIFETQKQQKTKKRYNISSVFEINAVLPNNKDINIHLNDLFNNGCYYKKINDNMSIYLNPYSFSNLQSNKYNNDFLQNLLNKMKNNILENNQSQSLIFHGDNASGKTTNFFMISNYMVLNESDDLNKILWASNQILISMCNTASIHNVNASRYIAIRKFSINKSGKLNGIQQNVKLLSPFICESSNTNSRNFHLFYQICNVLQFDSRFLLEKPSAFSCLNSNIDSLHNKAFGMDDNKQFIYMLRGLTILNVSRSKQQQICRLCSGILHLSNISCIDDIKGNDEMHFEFSNKDKQYLFAASYLMGIDMVKLSDILLPKSSKYFRDRYNSHDLEYKSQIKMQILYQRDVLIKSLYELLFEYINDIINQQFDEYFKHHDKTEDDKELFLIDISGRNDEQINNNRFSNLAANYSFDTIQNNINKQYIFENQKIFMNEVENYKFTNINHLEQCLQIIDDDKNGIISVFDYIDTHKYHKNDSNKIFDEMMRNRNYIQTDDTKFTLSHYPYHVSYDTKYTFDDSQHFEFDKLIELLSNSSLSISRKLINFHSEHRIFEFGESFGFNRINSVIKSCFDYLHDNNNNNINNHYMLCIRPNCNQDAADWDPVIIQQQLKAFNISEIIHIQQNVMPYTVDLVQTATKLSIVFGDTPIVLELNERNPSLFIISLFNAFNIDPSSYRIGKTMLFLSNDAKNNVDKLLNFNTPLPPSQCQKLKKIHIQTKLNRAKNVLSTYITLKNGWDNTCNNMAKQHQRNAIESVINCVRFLSPIIKIAKLKVEKERIEKRKERERLKQEKLRELRRLEMEKKKLEQDCEFEKRKRKKELDDLQNKWHSIQHQKQLELARIERETERAIVETQMMADDQLKQINESVFAHIHPAADNLSVDSSVIDALIEQKNAPQYKQLYNKMYKIQQQIQQLELQKRQSVINDFEIKLNDDDNNNDDDAPFIQSPDRTSITSMVSPLHVVGSPKLSNVSIQRSSKNNQKYSDELLELNYMIHHFLDEDERKRAKDILKYLYKYKQDYTNGKVVNPHNIFVRIRCLIKNTKPLIRYDLYKGFEELILVKHIKMYHILLKEVKKCGINLKEIMKAIHERDIDGKITQKERDRVLDIADILHQNTLLDRNVILQYLYELDSILKNLPHKDYVDVISLIETIVNEHNLPMFVHIFQPLRAQKEFLTKISFYFSEAMYKVFKILLDQMIDNIESDNHETNLDSIFRDLSKIFVKLPQHINMDEIVSEFLLYFVPPEYVHQFHGVTRYILSKRYELIKIAEKTNKKHRVNEMRDHKRMIHVESEADSQEYIDDNKLLKTLQKQINDLRKTTSRSHQNLQQTVQNQLEQQTKQTLRMEDKIDHLQNIKVISPNNNNRINPPPPPQINEDHLIRRVTKILDNKITNTHQNRKQSDDPYLDFINGGFDQFDVNKSDKIPLDTIPKVLNLLDITGPKKQTLINAFNDMCKLTEPEIHRHQYLSALLHTKGKNYDKITKGNKPTSPISKFQNITKLIAAQNRNNNNVISSSSFPPPPPPPPSHMMMNRMGSMSNTNPMRTGSKTFRGHGKTISAKQPAVIVLPEGKEVNFDNDMNEEIDMMKVEKIRAPTTATLLNDTSSIHGWAMRKGDTFFQTNKKRYIILCKNDHTFYWCMSDNARYPNGGLNLYNNHVHVTQHATTLRIKSSNKERIFNFGDTHTASKFYNAIIEIQKGRPQNHEKGNNNKMDPFQREVQQQVDGE